MPVPGTAAVLLPHTHAARYVLVHVGDRLRVVRLSCWGGNHSFPSACVVGGIWPLLVPAEYVRGNMPKPTSFEGCIPCCDFSARPNWMGHTRPPAVCIICELGTASRLVCTLLTLLLLLPLFI